MGEFEGVFEKSCTQLLICPYRNKEDFHPDQCRGWCEGYAWNEKTLPVKPEFFSKIQLKQMTRKIPLTEENVKNLDEELVHFLDGIVELQNQAAKMPLTQELYADIKKMQEINKDEYEEIYLLYADFRSHLRDYIRKVQNFQKVLKSKEK